eukprot:6146041-Alexandrium_andersonii.AAC.1
MCIRDRDQTLLDAQKPDLLGKAVPPPDGASGRPSGNVGGARKRRKHNRSASNGPRGRDRSPPQGSKSSKPPGGSAEICLLYNDGRCTKGTCPNRRQH